MALRSGLREFRLIEQVRRSFGRIGPSILRGIGDDTAIVHMRPGRQLLLTTDLLVEDIHFDLATAAFEDIGYKAAVANLSDIAAMGGTPHALLVSIAIPPTRSTTEIIRLYRGVMQALRPHEVTLVGGDTSASRRGLFVSITLTGSVPHGKALRRDGARPGDLLYTTGTLGDSVAGLQLLTEKRHVRMTRNARQYLVRRHLRPVPRIQAGQALSARRLATAAIDLSDGLSGDIRHLCEQSGVGAEIDVAKLPLSAAASAYAAARRVNRWELALRGGEDYELLFTVSPKHRGALDRLTRRQLGCTIRCIGIIRPKKFGLRLRNDRGTLQRFPNLSYEHFRASHERLRAR